MIRLSATMLALLLLVQDPDPATDYKTRLEQVKKTTAVKHVSCASYLASKDMHKWARDEFNKAIASDPDNEQARRGLGDKRSDDGTGWEVDPAAKIRSANEVKKEDEIIKVKTEYEKKLGDLGKSISSEWSAIGNAAEKAGLKAEAEAAFKKAIEYNANNESARKKLGYEKSKEGGWVSAADKALRAQLVDGIAKAPQGAEDKGTSETAGKIGGTMQRRGSEHFIIESTYLDQKSLGTLVQHAEHAYAMFHKMFNQKELFGSEKYVMVLLKDRSEHQKYVDAFYTGDATRKTFTRDKCAGMGGFPKSESFNDQRGEPANMDYVIHYPVQGMVGNVAGHGALWLLEGMSLWFTAKMKQTSAWACVDLAGTGTGNSGKNYQDPKNWPFVIKTWIKEGKDPAIEGLIKCANWAELDGAETVKAWSICDFLIAEQREKFIDFMQVLKSDKDSGESAFNRVFGWSLADLDARWKGWARTTYESAK